jgi:hypothetical protein
VQRARRDGADAAPGQRAQLVGGWRETKAVREVVRGGVREGGEPDQLGGVRGGGENGEAAAVGEGGAREGAVDLGAVAALDALGRRRPVGGRRLEGPL